jgi:hypothetical protein
MKRHRLKGFFFNLIFFSKDGILVTLQPQSDVVFPFPSVLTVPPNEVGQIARGM